MDPGKGKQMTDRHAVASGEKKSGHVDNDTHISVSDVVYEMGGRKSRYINEVLNWYRQEDARNLRREELSDLVENTTALDALEGESWNSWKIAESLEK